MAAYWTVRGTRGNKQFALAYRSAGLGCIVLMHTTDESLGPGRYTLITQQGENASILFWSNNNSVLPYNETVPIMLMESQQTPEWFLL